MQTTGFKKSYKSTRPLHQAEPTTIKYWERITNNDCSTCFSSFASAKLLLLTLFLVFLFLYSLIILPTPSAYFPASPRALGTTRDSGPTSSLLQGPWMCNKKRLYFDYYDCWCIRDEQTFRHLWCRPEPKRLRHRGGRGTGGL